VNAQGQRFSVSAARMQAEGVKRGVPDVFLPVAAGGWHGLWVELKAGKNTTSDAQDEWLGALRRQGYAAFVIWDEWDEAREIIESYLAGKLRGSGEGAR